jgi:hypothetical protein
MMQAKPQANLQQPKTYQPGKSLSHTHFIKYLMCTSKKPQKEYGENLEKARALDSVAQKLHQLPPIRTLTEKIKTDEPRSRIKVANDTRGKN